MGKMSIATRTGDSGTTGLMYNRRVPKNHPRVEACGAVDELNAAIGLARASTEAKFIRENLLPIQQNLITLMGELATMKEDLPRFQQDGFGSVNLAMTARVDSLVKEIEAQNISFKGWATPGTNLASSALDLARTTCRRAERRVVDLQAAHELENPEILIFLNRLSDLLWLFARWVENHG